MEERLLKKQSQLNDLIKNGHVIISTNLQQPPTTYQPLISSPPMQPYQPPQTVVPSPNITPSKETTPNTPQKRVDSKYYKTETTKIVQEKFNNVSTLTC